MNKLAFVLLSILCMSCAFTNSRFEYPSQPGVDFTHGKWLLNTLNVPPEVATRLKAKIMKDLSAQLGDRLRYYPDTRGVLLPQNIGMQPSRETIMDIGRASNFDYFVNITANVIRDDLGSVSFDQRANASLSNSSYVALEIYDLRAGTVLYSQKVVSTVNRPNSENGVMLSSSSANLVIHAYNKLFKQLAAKSEGH